MTTTKRVDGGRPTAKPYAGVSLRDAPPGFQGNPKLLRVDPSDNILVGGQSICAYIGISSISTLWRWVELFGFPAVRRPDGLWMSSMTAIDQWIWMASEIEVDKAVTSKGQQTTIENAIRRLEYQRDHPEVFEQKRRNAARRAAKGVALLPGRKEPVAPYLTGHDAREERRTQSGCDDSGENADG